ncbi:uncharacterized protein BJ171DRAFT_496618 [Polychytrium aggregatum]|uniref:uncharacterized protein n=1 Tax=Polychytrium aggregatum TaxID=110093 RepID=UPI0022FE9F5A|nr:uncharacterized protein BJ171DRAFT_496618 [Polychytrium aggregatum]KAI9206703.1 hypothetical protein BJ171DRAFT_496618 [Polychytrium aggregatum]
MLAIRRSLCSLQRPLPSMAVRWLTASATALNDHGKKPIHRTVGATARDGGGRALEVQSSTADHSFRFSVSAVSGSDRQSPTSQEYLVGALAASVSHTLRQHCEQDAKLPPVDHIVVTADLETIPSRETQDHHKSHRIELKVDLIGAHLTHSQKVKLVGHVHESPIYQLLNDGSHIDLLLKDGPKTKHIAPAEAAEDH